MDIDALKVFFTYSEIGDITGVSRQRVFQWNQENFNISDVYYIKKLKIALESKKIVIDKAYKKLTED